MIVVAGAALLLATGIGIRAGAATLPLPTLIVDFSGKLSPKTMSRHEYVPVAAASSGAVKTTDGTHPSALREAIVDVDRDLKVNVDGLPVCRRRQLEKLDTPTALKVCGNAVVGRGTGEFAIAFPEQKPLIVAPPITVFNGGERGGTIKLLIHTLIRVPRPTPLVAVATSERRGGGLHTVVRIPVAAEGAGSLIDFQIGLGRTYVRDGRKLSLLEARCPDGRFRVNLPKLLFKNETTVSSVPTPTTFKGGFSIPCTARG